MMDLIKSAVEMAEYEKHGYGFTYTKSKVFMFDLVLETVHEYSFLDFMEFLLRDAFTEDDGIELIKNSIPEGPAYVYAVMETFIDIRNMLREEIEKQEMI